MVYYLSLFLLLTLPFQFVLPTSVGWDVPLARLLAAAVILVFLVLALFRRRWQLPDPILTGAIVSFLGIVSASVLWAERPELALPKIVFLLNLLPLIFIWHDLGQREPGRLENLIRGIIFGAAGAALVGLVIFFSQFLFGTSEVFHFMIDRLLPFFLGQELGALVANYPSLLVNIDGQTLLRATAFFPDPHVAAFFFGMCGFLALGVARKDKNPGWLLAAAVLFLADVLSFSRGGYIGLISGTLIYIFLSLPTHSPKYMLRLGGGIVGIMLLFGLFGQSALSRFATSFSLADTSSTERLVLWREAASVIAQYPVAGVGIGNYLSSARPLYETGTPFYAHDLYLDIAVETGLIGLLSFLLILSIVLKRLFEMRAGHPFAPAAIAALILYLAHSVFETALFSLHVTIVLAFIIAVTGTLKPEEA